ncbi:hypothetical protein CTAYLR_002918 [Chrysophaeum taylorii]|uniref:DUF4200 domain-containing protein n=1 Tax=Chrysophaeum taylorii TaxID=2483200 RepID=A0AAD7UMI3_9STRA|nr:hypothetical protein CTAYLR_002918 [Chrysophaeum taylorii]
MAVSSGGSSSSIYARPPDLPQTLALDHVSPATRLLEKRRQMFEVQEALDAQKEEYLRHEDAFRRREEALRRKDVELQDSLIKFNKFLQENESKRKRAITRAADERKQIENKEADIDRLERQYRNKVSDAKALEKDLQRNKICQEFLTDVCVHLTEDYHEIQDLLNRYSTLRGANDDLSRRQKDYEDLSEKKKEEFILYMKERSNEMLNANNEIALLQDKLEQTEATTYRLQAEVDSAIRGMSDKTLELCQILAAVDNLFRRLRRQDARAVAADQLDNQAGQLAFDRLDEISSYILDYADICAEYENYLHR